MNWNLGFKIGVFYCYVKKDNLNGFYEFYYIYFS